MDRSLWNQMGEAMKFYRAEIIVVTCDDLSPEKIIKSINKNDENIRIYVYQLEREEKTFSINMVNTDVEILFSTECAELRKENKRLKDKLESIKARVMEIL